MPAIAACVVPWNYPLLMATWKVAPCLAAGCTCVLKPSELAPLTMLLMADICREAGLPEDNAALELLSKVGPSARHTAR